MKELASRISRQAGISEEQAWIAIQLVMDHLLAQLPVRVAHQVKAWSGWDDRCAIA